MILQSIPTRITKLFGIRYPIIQAGMIWAAGHKLASAVSNCGGLGLIGGGSMDPDLFRRHIRRCREETDKPFGVNIPLLYKHADDLVKVALEEGVKIIFTSAGNPGKYTAAFHEAGAVVTHVVPTVAFARKAAERGVDAIVAEGTEAGGHNSPAAVTTLALVPQVVDAVKVPVIAAGGIADGRGMAAAFALGASAAQMGTRFACTVESSAHPNYKQAIVNASDESTVLTLLKTGPTRMIRNAFVERVLEAEARGATPEEIHELLGRRRAKAGIFEGDVAEGNLEAGQSSGLIREILTVPQVFDLLLSQYRRALCQMPMAGLPGICDE
jgi:enoyl-[acyl-carrier protein] reductase II